MKIFLAVIGVFVLLFGAMVCFAGGMSDNIPMGQKWGAAGVAIMAAAVAGIIAAVVFL